MPFHTRFGSFTVIIAQNKFDEQRHFIEVRVTTEFLFFNPLNANPTKWSNALKQFVCQHVKVSLTILWGWCLTLSRRRPISYRNQSIDLLCKSVDWFLYNIGLRRERVKGSIKPSFSAGSL